MYKILIVDDEPANLRALERLFRGQYEVLLANSANEALEILREPNQRLVSRIKEIQELATLERSRISCKLSPEAHASQLSYQSS